MGLVGIFPLRLLRCQSQQDIRGAPCYKLRRCAGGGSSTNDTSVGNLWRSRTQAVNCSIDDAQPRSQLLQFVQCITQITQQSRTRDNHATRLQDTSQNYRSKRRSSRELQQALNSHSLVFSLV